MRNRSNIVFWAVTGVLAIAMLVYVAQGCTSRAGASEHAENAIMECAERLIPTAPSQAVEHAARTSAEITAQSEQEPAQDEEYYETDYGYVEAAYEDYSVSEYADYGYSRPGYTMDENGVVHAEYSEVYNTDGPSAEMPGWHDGFLETWYNASNHYLARTWTVDDEGFYHDENGRYVVGVEIHHQYDMPYGTVVETGKGEGVVYDYGAVWEVHDFATIW